jgi:hypothetical protein
VFYYFAGDEDPNLRQGSEEGRKTQQRPLLPRISRGGALFNCSGTFFSTTCSSRKLPSTVMDLFWGYFCNFKLFNVIFV